MSPQLEQALLDAALLRGYGYDSIDVRQYFESVASRHVHEKWAGDWRNKL